MRARGRANTLTQGIPLGNYVSYTLRITHIVSSIIPTTTPWIHVNDSSAPQTDDRHLQNPFAPATEEITAFDLPVSGALPANLEGRYLRIGPNALGVEDPAAHQWSAGPGMVHGVRIRDGKAEWYRNRWVRSPGVRDALNESTGNNARPAGADVAPNTTVIAHAGRTLALMEAGALPYELDSELNTVGIYEPGITAQGFTTSPHAKFDPHTGELHSLAYLPGVEFVQHIVSDSTGQITQVTDIPIPGETRYMHDFSLTQRYVILYDTPAVFDSEALQRGIDDVSLLTWDDDSPGRVGILPRAGGPVRWIESDPSFIGHTLNAYDDGSSIVLDVIRMDGPVNVNDAAAMRPTLDRWTVDLRAGVVRQQRLDDRPQEFPRVNDLLAARPHRYGYSAANAVITGAFPTNGEHHHEVLNDALIKHDFDNGSAEVHGFPNGTTIGEAAFAAEPAGSGKEDDGYLMAYAHDPERGAADLVILSAQDFTGPPLARVHLPTRVPLGFHGSWIPDHE